MEEIWVGISGYENDYQVSNLGNVRSLNYRRTEMIKNLTPKENNCGRLWVELKGKPLSIKQCCEGKRKTAYGFKWQYAI